MKILPKKKSILPYVLCSILVHLTIFYYLPLPEIFRGKAHEAQHFDFVVEGAGDDELHAATSAKDVALAENGVESASLGKKNSPVAKVMGDVKSPEKTGEPGKQVTSDSSEDNVVEEKTVATVTSEYEESEEASTSTEPPGDSKQGGMEEKDLRSGEAVKPGPLTASADGGPLSGKEANDGFGLIIKRPRTGLLNTSSKRVALYKKTPKSRLRRIGADNQRGKGLGYEGEVISKAKLLGYESFSYGPLKGSGSKGEAYNQRVDVDDQSSRLLSRILEASVSLEEYLAGLDLDSRRSLATRNELDNSSDMLSFVEAGPPSDIRIELLIEGVGGKATEAVFLRRAHPMKDPRRAAKKSSKVAARSAARAVYFEGMAATEYVLNVARAVKGAYEFSFTNALARKRSFRLKVLIYEGTGRERSKKYEAILEKGRSFEVSFIIPEAVFWDDDFTGMVEDSGTITKFDRETGLVWKDGKDN